MSGCILFILQRVKVILVLRFRLRAWRIWPVKWLFEPILFQIFKRGPILVSISAFPQPVIRGWHNHNHNQRLPVIIAGKFYNVGREEINKVLFMKKRTCNVSVLHLLKKARTRHMLGKLPSTFCTVYKWQTWLCSKVLWLRDLADFQQRVLSTPPT